MAAPAASTVATVFDYAEELLTLCDEALLTTPSGTIDRKYVSPGVPAIDCATLAVWPSSLGLDTTNPTAPPPSGHRHVYGMLNLIGFGIAIVRDCVPVTGARASDPPLAAALSASAEIISADVWAIWDLIPKRMAEGDLFGGRCTELYMDSALSLPTQGQTAGFVVNVRASVRGISA